MMSPAEFRKLIAEETERWSDRRWGHRIGANVWTLLADFVVKTPHFLSGI
jgi:hypothetical protein